MDTRSFTYGKELAERIGRFTSEDGIISTAIPGLTFICHSQELEKIYSVYEPSLCIIAQGSKIVMLGAESYRYDPSSYLTTSVHLPIIGQVMEASPEAPFLSLRLNFDTEQILDVIQSSGPALKPKRETQPERGLAVSRMNEALYEAVLRLVKLLDSPIDIPVLAPYVIREILYRLLQNEHGSSIQQFTLISSHAQRIAQVIERMKSDFTQPLRMDELAAAAGMSASSFFAYFKEVTAMSPLQYQKQLRLQEARRLLLSSQMDAAEAAFQVGYESATQFSREYARFFGQPPIRDIRRFRSSLQLTESLS
ncbi:AraC family transcriptional regulator [Paenibacillus physcomitrellae]|uniref:AraC family transcriptional regulator n=1 Tax=Paenibacillus physcomitrellae TaxID=1619311 RepID=A0ABQ1GLG5_9BACL|nr:AraC family transcriptional regulator [Paenibacillus physcomitrellae]GGA46165.1 AraC family transcriptional regulator [Paenibacillus physcomitrellae]